MMTNMYCGKLFLHAAFKPNVLTTPITLLKETDEEWLRPEKSRKFSKKTKYFRLAYFEDFTDFHHISVSFPKEAANEQDQIWGIEWSAWRTATATQNKIYDFTTTIPHGIIPNNEKELCENFLKYLHKKWDDICSCKDKQLKYIVSCDVYQLFWLRTGLRILPILPPQTAQGTAHKAG